jgi:hypothetical protein
MAKKRKAEIAQTDVGEYSAVLSDISALLDRARRTAARSVNAVLTATYWEVGRRIGVRLGLS